LSFFALAFHGELKYRYANACINSGGDIATSFKNLVNFGPVTPEFTGIICVPEMGKN